MKKIIFTVFFILSILMPSKAQTNTANEFYAYLNKTLKNNNDKTINILVTIYGCLESKYNWEAKLIKDKNTVEIQFYSYRPKDIEHLDLIVKRLDTTFIVTRKELIKKFKTEIIAVKSRRVFLEETFKIIVNSEYSNKEFNLQRADGLSDLIRYNMSTEQCYIERRKTKK